MAEIKIPENSTLIRRDAPAYIYAFTGIQEMGTKSQQMVVGYPIVIFYSIVPETKTTLFEIAATPVPGISPKPVLFLQSELQKFVGMKLTGWDRVFWMSLDYYKSDDFITACTILRQEYGTTDAQIMDLATTMTVAALTNKH